MILLTYPKVLEDSSSSQNKEHERPPITGTIDEDQLPRFIGLLLASSLLV
jgi:hypothetical protein